MFLGVPAKFTDPKNREFILDLIDDYLDVYDAVMGDKEIVIANGTAESSGDGGTGRRT